MKTKNKTLILVLLMLSTYSYGQIRVGDYTDILDATNSSAFIDASSNNAYNISDNIGKGLIFPRVDLTKFTFSYSGMLGLINYPSRYDGFMVYNTATSGQAINGSTEGTLTAGFWYYDNKSTSITGGTWRPFKGSGSSATVTADNGLTKTGDKIQFGGPLLQATDITGGFNLNIGTPLQISSGTPGAGKVLTSDAFGNTTWTFPESLIKVKGITPIKVDEAKSGNTTTYTTSITGGTNGQVLKTNAAGNAVWDVDNAGVTTISGSGPISVTNGSTSNPTIGFMQGGNTNDVLTWNGSSWISSPASGVTTGNLTSANTAATITTGTSRLVGGNASITVNNTSAIWNANQLQGKNIATTAPSSGQVLKWNGSAWAPAADADSYSSTTIIAGVSSVSPSWGTGATFNPASYTGSSWADTGTRITLPVGRWLIMASMLMSIDESTYPNTSSQVWVRSTFQRVSGGSISYYDGSSTPNELISGNLYSGGHYMMSGYVVINVTGSAAVLRYVVGNCELWGTWPSGRTIKNFGGKSGEKWRENSITAFALRN